MCMNKFIMSPEFMPGALRNHEQTQFSKGGLQRPLNPQLLLRLAALANRSTSENFAPPRNGISLRPWGEVVKGDVDALKGDGRL